MTPNFPKRTALADALFLGRTSPQAARRFVTQTTARFLLSDCSSQPALAAKLATTVVEVHRFGCAAVYVVA